MPTWATMIPYLRIDNLKNHTLSRGTYLYSPHMGVPPHPRTSERHSTMPSLLINWVTAVLLVSFAAVIRVVTQCSSPTNGCSLELYIPFLKLTNKDQASISWKPGPLAANVTRNMIGAAANSYMHVVGSQ